MKNHDAFQQIAIAVDHMLDHSNSIKTEMIKAIFGWSELLHINQCEAKELAMYHALNISRYNEMFQSNKETFCN